MYNNKKIKGLIMQIEDYDFSIIALIKEGFRRSNGVKWIFMGALLLFIIIQLIFATLLVSFIPTLTQYVDSVVTILTLPIAVGIIMLGIKRAREQELHVSDIFNYFGAFPYLILAYILMVIFISIGFLFLILPGIYLAIAYSFTLALITDKNMPVWEAMELSRKIVTKQWFKFFGLAIISLFILLVSIIPFGIGIIWSIPTLYISYGLLYHRLFDEESY
jgi:uncharacterized membrane protein